MQPRDDPQRDESPSKSAATADDLKFLGNPITVIRGYTQLLQRRLNRGEAIEDEELRGTLGRIERASHAIVMHLRELSDRWKDDEESGKSK